MECARRWQSPTESSTVTAWAGVASRLTTDVNSTHWSPPMGSATAAEGGKGVGFEQLIPEQGLRGSGAGCLPGSRDACATVDEDSATIKSSSKAKLTSGPDWVPTKWLQLACAALDKSNAWTNMSAKAKPPIRVSRWYVPSFITILLLKRNIRGQENQSSGRFH